MSVATLAGVALLNADTVGWDFSDGVEPHTRIFECHKRDAQEILNRSAGGKEVILIYVKDGRKEQVDALSVMSVAPATHPDRMSVVVADRRIWWLRKLIVGDFNHRRKSGELRLVDGANLQRIPPAFDITFTRYSLKDELTPWTAKTLIENVLDQLTEGNWAAADADWSKQSEVDGISLRDSGPVALRRVLALVPGLSVWMDRKGITRLKSKSDGSEAAELVATGPPVDGPTLPVFVDYNRSRPKSIEVFFQCEDEVRFDFLEGISYTTDAREPRILENVLPLPDTVTINGVRKIKGTWAEITQALLDAWNNDPEAPRTFSVGNRSYTIPPLTFDRIRRLFMAPGGYTIYFEAFRGSNVWAARIDAVLQHYRQTFRIPRRWADRSYMFQPTRLSIVDPENGTRAPADVFLDYCRIPGRRRLAFKAADDTTKLGVNQLAWEISDSARLLANGKYCAQAVIVTQDPDCFVFKVVVQPSPTDMWVLPSALSSKANGDDTDIPSMDPRVARGMFLLQKGKLAARHRLATVLTLGSAAPTHSRLYKVPVKPDEAKPFLPVKVQKQIGSCNGPVMQVFVNARLATARFAWTDEAAKNVEQSILDGAPRDKKRLLDPQHVENVARAFAAAIYAQFTDRWEGSKTVAFDPNRKPVGRIQSVSHQLHPKGQFVTVLDLSPDLGPVDFMAYLPESTRREMFRKVQF